MKKLYVILSIFFTLSLFTLPAYSSVSLKITNTDLDCREDYITGGFDYCDFNVDVRIDTYSYGKEYDYLNNLTYIVECKADIEYKTFNRDLGTTFPHWEQVHERESFYGVSWSSKTITFDINFWHFEPVIQVFPSSLSCRIINAY